VTDPVRPGRSVERAIVRYHDGAARYATDAVVTEEPLELRLAAGESVRPLAVTMRTPGNDLELAAGFAFSEGIIGAADELSGVSYCIDPNVDVEQRYNIVTIALRTDDLPDTSRFERHFTTNSACGVCGKANLDALRDAGTQPLDDDIRVAMPILLALPDAMRNAQRVFEATGALHAAALFASDGSLLALREDVGRHNAVDKLVGWALANDRLPLSHCIMLVSGRASYEILQKAAVARIPIVCAISAPSSLAIDLARAFNVTLVGFMRGTKANVYAGEQRILQEDRGPLSAQ